jgi:hypothetical protein
MLFCFIHEILNHMLDFDPSWVPWLCLGWLVLVGLLILDLRADQSNGLPLVFAANLTMLHLPGGGILLVEWYGYYPKNWTYTGLVYSLAFLAFFVLGGFFARGLSAKVRAGAEAAKSLPQLRQAGLFLFVFGVLSMMVLKFVPALSDIPSLGTVVGVFWSAAAAGMCLYLYAFQRMESAIPLRVFVMALFFPIVTVVVLGFLGFGLAFVIALACFFVSRKFVGSSALLLLPVLAYVGISLGVNYFDKRSSIREASWVEASEVESAVAASKIFTEFEWFDPENTRHLNYLDQRLNQNFLVGASVEAVERGTSELLRGESLSLALIAWIPRAIWADKPIVAGSTDLVARATGLDFAIGTSVGIGSVLEFYANFGSLGMCFCAALLGFGVRYLDRKSATMLTEGSLFNWLLWFLMGYALTVAGGQLSESIGQIAASWVAILVLRFSYQLYYIRNSERAVA